MENTKNIFHKNFGLISDRMLDLNFKKATNWLDEKEKLGNEILELLFDCGAIKTWFREKNDGWILHSGLWSPIYISLREISSKKNGSLILKAIGISLSKLIVNEIPKFDKILGLETTGIQIVTAITILSNIPSLYTRKIQNKKKILDFEKELKKYGEHELIEGEFEDNDTIIIVDDLVTKFDSVIKAKEQLFYVAKQRNKNIICKDVVILLDREQGAKVRAKEENLNLHTLIPLKSKLHWLEDKFDPQEYSVIKDYFEDYSKFQNQDKIKEIISLAKI